MHHLQCHHAPGGLGGTLLCNYRLFMRQEDYFRDEKATNIVHVWEVTMESTLSCVVCDGGMEVCVHIVR